MKKGEKCWGKLLIGLLFIIGCSLFTPLCSVKAASLHGKSNEEKIFSTEAVPGSGYGLGRDGDFKMCGDNAFVLDVDQGVCSTQIDSHVT